MDAVDEIKAKLPIEDLVGQYVQLQKKGRNFTCLCPFHNDTHPSFVVSPDKGIAYCFACNSGGDIFSFYQRIENVDFRQALKDLAERTGVHLDVAEVTPVKKDEKDRLRSCLQAALGFFQQQLAASKTASAYLVQRKVPPEQVEQWELGFAPDSFSATYEHLLREGYSRSEILAAGLGVQKDLKEERIYDRFRNRLIFPIHDPQGRLVGFGGRTLGEDDAKYINSSEGPLYRKAQVLYGFHHAKDSLREKGKVVMVEGYFDVLACHRCGINNVVAVSGTALTEEHVKLLKRHAETVVLCLDQDRAGEQAAERAFHLLSAEGIAVHATVLPAKDPDELAAREPALLTELLEAGGKPYVEMVLERLSASFDLAKAEGKNAFLKQVLPLLKVLPTAVERSHYVAQVAALLHTTETALEEDLSALAARPHLRAIQPGAQDEHAHDLFSPLEVTLALLVLYPETRHLIEKLIPPDDERMLPVYEALKQAPAVATTLETLAVPESAQERMAIVLLFCEENGMIDWSQGMALQEVRRNCLRSNRAFLQRKQRDLAKQILQARESGKPSEESQLSTQYQQVLKLAKMAL